MYLTKKELEAVCGSIDFIEHNSDFADDRKLYDEMIDGLRSIRNKHQVNRHKRLVKYYLKKIKKSITKQL